MGTTNDGMPQWEFFLTTDAAVSLRDAGQGLLMQWQRNNGNPTQAMLKAQKRLSDALDEFVPQVNEILFDGVS